MTSAQRSVQVVTPSQAPELVEKILPTVVIQPPPVPVPVLAPENDLSFVEYTTISSRPQSPMELGRPSRTRSAFLGFAMLGGIAAASAFWVLQTTDNPSAISSTKTESRLTSDSFNVDAKTEVQRSEAKNLDEEDSKGITATTESPGVAAPVEETPSSADRARVPPGIVTPSVTKTPSYQAAVKTQPKPKSQPTAARKVATARTTTKVAQAPKLQPKNTPTAAKEIEAAFGERR